MKTEGRLKRYLGGNQCHTLKPHRVSSILKMTDLEIFFCCETKQ